MLIYVNKIYDENIMINILDYLYVEQMLNHRDTGKQVSQKWLERAIL